MNLSTENDRLLQLAFEKNQPTKYINISDNGNIVFLVDELKNDRPFRNFTFDQLREMFNLNEEELGHLYISLNYDLPRDIAFAQMDEEIQPHISRLNFDINSDFDNYRTIVNIQPERVRDSFLTLIRDKVSPQNWEGMKNFLTSSPEYTRWTLNEYKNMLKQTEMAEKRLTEAQYDNTENTLIDTLFGNYNMKFYKHVLSKNEMFRMKNNLKPLSKIIIESYMSYLNDLEQRDLNLLLNRVLEDTSPVPFKDFNIKKNEYKVELKFNNNNLDYIFDNIKTSFDIKYIKFNDYFKLYNEYIPEKEWIMNDSMPDTIYIRLIDIEVLVKIFKDEEDGKIYLSTIINKDLIQIDQLIQIISHIFVINFDVENTELFNIVGNYYIPEMVINRFLLTDMTFVDPQFRRFLVKNDNVFSNSRSDRIINSLNLRYYDPIGGKNTIIKITPKIVTKSELDIIDNPQEFKIGSWFLKISMAGKNINSINNFQYIFSRLLNIYKQRENVLFEYYKSLIPDFELHPIPSNLKEEDKLNLRDYAPYLFKKKFTSFCKPNRNPKIVDIYNRQFLESISDNTKFLRNYDKFVSERNNNQNTERIERTM